MTSAVKIFVLQPYASEFDAIYWQLKRAIYKLPFEIKIVRGDELVSSEESIQKSISNEIENSDLVICDISNENLNVMFELGYVRALKKPVVLISNNLENIPFDLKAVPILTYRNADHESFGELLRNTVSKAISSPAQFIDPDKSDKAENHVFISYSHHDRGFLERLMVHLSPLEKEGLIELWVDTKLEAGDKWKVQIQDALKRARVAVLLVTADFLASDFIIDNELPPLLKNAESHGTRIIPVICKPCRFARDKNLNHFQAINDPREPLISLSDGEQEKIFDMVSEFIEKSMN